MPLPLTVSCSSKIQIGFTFLVPAYPGCPGKDAVKWLLLLLYEGIKLQKFLWIKPTKLLAMIEESKTNFSLIIYSHGLCYQL